MRVPLVLCAVVAALAACGGPTDPAAVPTLGSEASFRAHIDLREERATDESWANDPHRDRVVREVKTCVGGA